MHRHFIVSARISAAAFLASVVLMFISHSASAQDQDANKQISDLVAEISLLSNRICGVTQPTDIAGKKLYDERRSTLFDDANQLNQLLEQRRPKGSDIVSKASNDQITGWEKSLKSDPNDPKACPVVPDDLQKAVNGDSAAEPVRARSATPAQVPVQPAAVKFENPQTIGSRSEPILVTVTNNTTDSLDLFIWYGTRLAHFWVTDDTCNGTTPPQGKCTFKVVFAPTEMPAPGYRELVESLWVVRREAWKKYDKIREGLKQVADAKAAAEKAGREVIEQDKELKDIASARQFCEHPQGKDQLLAACKNLKAADAKVTEVEKWATKNDFTESAYYDAANRLRDNSMAKISLSGSPIHWKYPLTRAVVGLDLSAVSSDTVRQAYFVDFNLLAPFKLGNANEDALESRWWFWLNPRITSLPKAADPSAISTIDEAGTFFTNFSRKGKTADIAQGFDVNGGIELALLKPRSGIPWWAEYVNTQARLGVSLIGGAGMATPFSTPDIDVTSQVNQSICDAFKAPAGTTLSGPGGLVCTAPSGTPPVPQVVAPNPAGGPPVNASFVTFFAPERSRFFRRYYGGIRLKTYFFSPDVKGECKPERKDRCDAPYDIFPGIVDLTAGQDEAVTAGKLSRVLFRIEGVYPLPFVPGFHVFGSIYTSFRHNTQSPPFNTFTVNAPTGGAANDANTFRFPLNPLDRDYFRLGVGIDLIQMLKRNKGGQPTTTTSSSSDQSGGSKKSQSGSNGSPN